MKIFEINDRITLDFDKLYGKAFKITAPEGDTTRHGFSIISRIANGSVWNEWQERPQFKSIVKQRLNDPDFLADYKYQQIIDSAKQLGLYESTNEFKITRKTPLYVIGDPNTYDPLLLRKKLRKAGKDFKPGYAGGQVFLTLPDAIKEAKRRRYGVYELKDPYRDDNVYQDKLGSYHLIHGMQVVRRKY